MGRCLAVQGHFRRRRITIPLLQGGKFCEVGLRLKVWISERTGFEISAATGVERSVIVPASDALKKSALVHIGVAARNMRVSAPL